MGGGVICRNCKAENDPAQRFCGSCGAPLGAPRCPSCGRENPADFRFCGSCGAALDAAAPARAAPAEERRWATVIFADLSGFTNLSERMDPEDVRSLVDRCMAKLGAIVERYGGAVERVIGDALLAVFGAPVSHEDDPERAVRAALEMVLCAEENAEEFAGLPLRIGVNTGEMMFAPVGPEGARHHTMMGDAVNVGARLQAAAPRSGVLVGEETHRATHHAISYEDVGAIQAKGKDEPVRAWRAVGTLGAPADRPLSEVPMVGRDRELGLLQAIWERVRVERRPHLVTAIGPPGIGKTRLSREVVAHVETHGGRCVRGRCLPYGETSGYGAFGQLVKEVAGILETDSTPEALDKLRRSLGSLAPDEAEGIARQLAVLIGLGVGETAADRQALFFAARRFVEALGRDRPTLLLFEDIHWADPSLLDLIESLAGRVRETPLLVLSLARPELLDVRPAWGGGLASYSALPLEPLSDADSVALIERLIPQVVSVTRLTERLAETAAGNPLFIEELTASVAERSAYSTGELPTNVKAIIAARLDALPPRERQVVLDASVVGKVFWRGAVDRLGPHPRLDEILETLEARDFVRREPACRIAGDVEFSFKHILIREVAYATLSRAARRERHAAVARFIQEATGDRIAESAAVLAHHWREAGKTDDAVECLLLAADHTARAWAKGEAVALYTEAIALIPEDDVERRRSILLRRARALVEASDFPAATKELDELLPQLEGREKLEALIARGRAAFWMVDAAGGTRAMNEARPLSDELGDAELRAITQSLSMEIMTLEGRLVEALRFSAQALAEWPPGGRQTEYANLLGLVGLSHYWLGHTDEAIDHARRGYAVGLEIQSLEATMVIGANLGLALAGAGRHEEALSFLEGLVARGREMELVPRFTCRAVNVWGGTLRDLYDLEAARLMNEEGIEMARRGTFLNGLVQGRIDLLYADIAVGEFGRAEAALPGLFEEAENLKGWHEWLVGGRLAEARAEVLLGLGRLEEAAEAASDATARAESYGRLKYEARSRMVLGRALLAMRKHADAVGELRRALEAAERLRNPPSVWRAAGLLGDALLAVADDEGARSAYARCRETIDSFAAALTPERRERFRVAPAVADVLAAARS